MEVRIIVEGENPQTHARWHCVDARVVFVAIDAAGKPVPVPALSMDSDDVRASQLEAEERRARRLSKR